MFKKSIALILSIVLILSIFIVAPASGSAATAKKWYAQYYSFIKNKTYLKSVDKFFKTESYGAHKFFIHDLDANGIPELLVNCGYQRGSYAYSVFTYRNNAVKHIGNTFLPCGTVIGSYPDSAYPGLFGVTTSMGLSNYAYIKLSGSKLQTVTVMTYSMGGATGKAKKGIISKTSNSKLYKAFTACIKKSSSKNYYYDFKYPVSAYTYAQVKKMGQDNFIGSYLYLASPKKPTLTNTKSGVKVTWKAVKGAEKYAVFMKNNGKWKRIAVTASTSYAYKAAKKGKKYTFTIRCISANAKKYTSRYNTSGTTITCKR